MSNKFKPIKGTDAGLKKQNPVLNNGDLCFEYPEEGINNNGKIKLGDGKTDYENLPYFINPSIYIQEINELKSEFNRIKEKLKSILPDSGVYDIYDINQLSTDWKYKLITSVSNASYTSTEEATNNFDDSSWETVTVPHDWSIRNDFNSGSLSTYEGGYLDGGDSWYRTHLSIPSLNKGERILICFEGVYMESDVYVNGTKVGINRNGYNPFYFDITEQINVGNDNVLAVFVRNNEPSSRWYSGSGIFRNVYLITARESKISIPDVTITTPDLKTQAGGNVNTVITAEITNNTNSIQDITFTAEIYNPDSNKVGEGKHTCTVQISGTNTETFSVMVNNPKLWSTLDGNLYKLNLYAEVENDNYSRSITFGYRYIENKSDGFYLNGKKTFLKGVCMHHDLGCIGAEVNSSAMERQINSMVEMGINAIRLTHNPSSPEFLELCAKKGILLIEELFDTWTWYKNKNDFARYFTQYKDTVIETTIKRDKNNPAIIMWSVGNEIIRTSQYTSDQATTIIDDLCEKVRKYDSTRFITMGEDRPTDDVAKVVMAKMDMIGLNYGDDSEYATTRTNFPNACIYGSETTSALSSRYVYARNNEKYVCSSMDNDYVSWGDPAGKALKRHMDSEYIAGMFVWTGWDYIGEPTPFNAYPCKNSYFGIVDTAGFKKDVYYLYQSLWISDPMIHLLPHNWSDLTVGVNQTVIIYSNCYKVELYLNGSSLGSKLQSERNELYQFVYTVPFTKGTLVANGYDNTGKLIAQDVIYSSYEIKNLDLSTDKSQVNYNSDDLVFITCDAVDKNGNFVPYADNEVEFSVSGGTILGTDNGNSSCVTNMRSSKRVMFNGKVLAVVKHDKSSGVMTVTASCNGAMQKSITILKTSKTIYQTEVKSDFIDATNPPDFNPTISSITAKKVKTTYNVGDTVNTDDITVTVNYSNGDTKTVSDYKLSPDTINTDTAHDTTITVIYSDGVKEYRDMITIHIISKLLYELPEEKTFNAENKDFVDTGVSLLNKDRNFTLFLEFAGSTNNKNTADTHCVFHCMKEVSPWPGISFAIWTTSYGCNVFDMSVPNNITNPFPAYNDATDHKFVLTKENNTYTVYFDGAKIQSVSASYFQAIDQHLLLGCYQTSDGTKGRFWNGTVKQFKIWDGLLNESAILDL